MITGDFETRSACDLRRAGAWAYSKHSTTEVMCFCWHFNEDPIDKVYAWQTGYPHLDINQSPFPQELADRIAAGEILEAHNAFFEWCIWNHVWRKKFRGLPELNLEQIRCSAAKAAAFALPRALDKVTEALNLSQKKDLIGAANMKKLSKPRKLTIAEKKRLSNLGHTNPEAEILWLEDRDLILRNTKYCQQDVRAECILSSVLRDLSTEELKFWQMDCRMNARGMTCDIEFINTAIELAEIEQNNQNEELKRLTNGEVPKASSRIKFKTWMCKNGSPIPNTQKATIDVLLGLDPDDKTAVAELRTELKGITLNERTRRGLEIVRDVNRSSIAKYRQMLVQVSDSNRLRDMMLYCGASRTGRWSGKGTQPHNFIRGYSALMEEVCQDILCADPDRLRLLYGGSVLEVLSKATRGALVASDNKKLMVADFSAIEARILLWLAEATEALEVFYRKEDIYLDMASAIFKYPCTDKDNFSFERQIGKAAILGLGYQMGWEKFENECRDKNNITDQGSEFFKSVVHVYRKERFPEITSFWYDMNKAAIQAVKRYKPEESLRGPVIQCRKIDWFMWGQFLHAKLPSGRLLSYFRPTIKVRTSMSFSAMNERDDKCSVVVYGTADMTETAGHRKAIEKAKVANKKLVLRSRPSIFREETLTFLHENPKTRKLERKDSYGGELVENVTQATARDFLASAMLRIDDNPVYDLLLSVHDEIIAECDKNEGNLAEFELLMKQAPDWGKNCPIDVEGWSGFRYRK